MLDPETAAPEVTVVVPAYRAAAFVHGAVDSALAQTGVRLEVLVVDDGCPEGTGDVVERRYADRPEVRVVRLGRNRGPSAARNAGFDAATAPWVAVLDADDAFEPGRLQRLVAVGEAWQVDVVADNVRLFDPTLGRTTEPRIHRIRRPTLLDAVTFVDRARPGTGELDYGLLKPVFRRATVTELGIRYPEDVRHGEDFELYLGLILAGARFLVVPEPGYLWTVRTSGMSRTRVDYAAQHADALRLRGTAPVREVPGLDAALVRRADALTRLGATREFRSAVKQRRVVPALRVASRNPRVLRELGRAARRRARRAVRRGQER